MWDDACQLTLRLVLQLYVLLFAPIPHFLDAPYAGWIETAGYTNSLVISTKLNLPTSSVDGMWHGLSDGN